MPGEIVVSIPKFNFFTSSLENESAYSPVGSMIKVFLFALITLSKIDNAEVDLPLLVAPTTNMWWSNIVLGFNDTSASFISRYVANGWSCISIVLVVSIDSKYLWITILLAK